MSLDAILGLVNEKAASAKPIGTKVAFDLEGDAIYVDGSGDANVVSTEATDVACTFKLSKDDFTSMANGDLNPMNAFMGGKLKIEGDMAVAMKLQAFFA